MDRFDESCRPACTRYPGRWARARVSLGIGTFTFLLAAQAQDEGPVKWAVLQPAASYHQQRTHANKPYNEDNAGIGLERRSGIMGWAGWELALSASVLQDSFNANSLFTGASATKALVARSGLELRLGALAGLAYKYTQWEGPRKLVPYVAPTVILRTPNGAGWQLSYAYHQNATTGRTNGVYTLQTSVLF